MFLELMPVCRSDVRAIKLPIDKSNETLAGIFSPKQALRSCLYKHLNGLRWVSCEYSVFLFSACCPHISHRASITTMFKDTPLRFHIWSCYNMHIRFSAADLNTRLEEVVLKTNVERDSCGFGKKSTSMVAFTVFLRCSIYHKLSEASSTAFRRAMPLGSLEVLPCWHRSDAQNLRTDFSGVEGEGTEISKIEAFGRH